jgi:transposase
MSLRPITSADVPASTAAVARAAFPRGNACLRLRDALGSIFADQQFAPLFPSHGQPAEAPWRLALVTLLQFAENLSDRRAAEAVRGRIDWNYLLGLELTDPGFDASVLSEFRTRLIAGGAEALLCDTLLALCRERGLLAKRGRQRTDSTHVLGQHARARTARTCSDSTHVLGAVRALNRLGCAIESLRAALNALAAAAPDWLRAHADPTWVERSAKPADDVHVPQGEAARRTFAEQVGRDGHALLGAVVVPDAPKWLREVPAVEVLRRVWVQTFCLVNETEPAAGGRSEVRWRSEVEGFPPSLLRVASPYDPDVHYAKKRQTSWIGYKVHLTETCEDAQPHLITHVETTPAPVVDRAVLSGVHEALKAKDLRPDRHLVDAGYVDADHLVASARDHAITLVGPVPKDNQWQARTEGAFTIDQFALDRDRQVATCPAGHTSESWIPDTNQGHGVMRIRFSLTHCRAWPLKARCTRSNRRLLSPRRREEHEALVAARAREADPAFAAEYRQRAGIEGTLSEGVRVMGLRRSRYLGLGRVGIHRDAITAAARWIMAEKL